MPYPDDGGRLSPEQMKAVAADRSHWAGEWSIGVLEGRRTFDVLGRVVGERGLFAALVNAYTTAIPEYAWDVMGANRSFPDSPAKQDVRPLATRQAIVIDGYVEAVARKDAAIATRLRTGELQVSNLLRNPPDHLPTTFPLFQAVRNVRKQARKGMADYMRVEPAIQLGSLPDELAKSVGSRRAAKSLNVWRALPGYRGVVAPDVPSFERPAYLAAVEQRVAASEGLEPLPGSDRRDLLEALVVVEHERRRLESVARGDTVAPIDAPACLPNGALGDEHLNQLAAAKPFGDRWQRKTPKGTKTTASGLATLAAEAVLPPHLWAEPPTPRPSGSLDAISPWDVVGRVLGDFLHSVGPLVATAVSLIGGVRLFVDIPTQRARLESNRNRESYFDAREQVRAQREIARQPLEQTRALIERLTDAFAAQCAADDRALDTGQITGQAALRATMRRIAFGKAPADTSPQWHKYAIRVTAMEQERLRSELADDCITPAFESTIGIAHKGRAIGRDTGLVAAL